MGVSERSLAVRGQWPLGVWAGAAEWTEALAGRPQSSPTETGPRVCAPRGGVCWKEDSGFRLEQPAARCRLLQQEDGRDGGACGTPVPRRHWAGTSTRGRIAGSGAGRLIGSGQVTHFMSLFHEQHGMRPPPVPTPAGGARVHVTHVADL